MSAGAVMGIRDDRGGTHVMRIEPGVPLSFAVRNFTNQLITRGIAPAVVLTCIPGGKR